MELPLKSLRNLHPSTSCQGWVLWVEGLAVYCPVYCIYFAARFCLQSTAVCHSSQKPRGALISRTWWEIRMPSSPQTLSGGSENILRSTWNGAISVGLFFCVCAASRSIRPHFQLATKHLGKITNKTWCWDTPDIKRSQIWFQNFPIILHLKIWGEFV